MNTLKNKNLKTEPKKIDDIEHKQILPINYSLKTIEGIKNKFLSKRPDVMCINMELRNGTHYTFLINAKSDKFIFMKGTYILDNNIKYYHQGLKMYMLDYHQDFSLPVQRKIDVDNIKKMISSSGLLSIPQATNPFLISQFIESKVTEGLMKSSAIDDFLKQIKLFIIITMLASVIMLILFVVKTGMLQAIHLPNIFPK